MKTAIRVLLIVCLLTSALIFFASSASADDRITFGVNLYAETAGSKGGVIIMNISIQNPTVREIDWIEFRVNTAEPYYERWTGDDGVPPFCNRTNRIDVYFAPEDLDKDRFLQLAINYDGDANPDDIKMQTIRISSIDEVISVRASSDPDGGPFIVGDAVFATHRLTNNADYRAVDLVVQCVMTNESGERIADTGPTNIERLDEGESIGLPIGAEFSVGDKEYVQVSYALAYTYLGQRYAITDETIFMPVMHPAFTAELSAPFYNADYGTETDLNLRLTNTGNAGFGSFYIENPEGVHVANGEALAAGESVDIPIPFVFFDYDEWDMRYIITGDYGYGDKTRESNTIHMACNAPTESPEAAAQTTEELAELTGSLENDEVVIDIEPDEQAGALLGEDADEAQAQSGNNLALYIVIGVLGLLIAAGAAVITFLVVRSKRKGSGKRGEKL